MIDLPLVERELRLAARRTSTYRKRFWAALFVFLIAFSMMLMTRHTTARLELGRSMFGVLTGLAFGYCLLAGVAYTSDCLSEEKREGTLGFLFLTDLRGYDVVLGKLAVTSLEAVYALLAAFPILGLPVLLGGVTGLEFWRTSLVLLNALFFSLALGLLVSALGRKERTVMLGTFWAVLFFAFGLPALWKIAATLFDSRFLDMAFLLPSPAYAYRMAASESRIGMAEYWRSMEMIAFLTLSCIGFSSYLLPRVFRQSSSLAESWVWAERFRRWRFRVPKDTGGEARAQESFETNPYLRVVARDRMPRIYLGVFVVAVISFCIWARPVLARKTAAFMAVAMLTWYGFHFVLKLLVAAEACRQINDDKRGGVLEMLLSTRLTIGAILGAQRIALRRLFWLPIFALALVNMVLAMALGGRDAWIFLGAAAMLVFDSLALSWVGMRVALRGQHYHWAVFETMARVMVPAWALFAGFMFVSINGGVRSPGPFFFWWFVAGGVYDLCLGSWARAGVERDLPTNRPRVWWEWVPVSGKRWQIRRRDGRIPRF